MLGNTLLQILHKHSKGRIWEHMDAHSLEVKGQQMKVWKLLLNQFYPRNKTHYNLYGFALK